MVYKLRNKNLFMTASGYKNNWAPVGFMMPKEYAPDVIFNVKTRYDHHSYLRRRSV